MVIGEVQVASVDASAALHILFDLPAPFRPVEQSIDENGRRSPLNENLIIDGVNNGTLATTHLWADRSAFEVEINSNCLTIHLRIEDADRCRHLIHDFARLSVCFAFACDPDERVHRNRISRIMPYGVQEGWVGRRGAGGLPGVYWLTVVPESERARLDLNIEDLRALSVEVVLHADRNWVIQLYESPGDWRARRVEVDHWCDVTGGVFSKSQALVELNESDNFIEASAVFARWA